MKKIRIFIYSMVAFLGISAGTQTHAQLSDFGNQLLNMNIPIHSILSSTGINRYELTRLLNAVECKDCIVANDEYLNRYTNLFWQKFAKEPGRDFDDILYRQAIYNKKSYYYCVAYVGDRTYMRGYPVDTSPVCAGQFCGERFTTKAEFLQVIMNMIAKYLYPTYALHRNNVQERISDLSSRSYQYKTFTKDDLDIIKKRAKDCGKNICTLQDSNELNIYLKYCMFNLKECGMIPFEKIKEGYRPVAELNLLYRQQIITLNDAVKYNINERVDGKLAVEILGKINSLIGCSFDNDYDCDGILNHEDSCPNTYNPQQRDLDGDGIGNVCDDDIDGDGIKNPIGIVDENDNINIALWTEETDNCLFIINPDQSDLNGNNIGDICEKLSQKLSLSIAIQKMEGTLPKTVTFGALSKGPFSNLKWDFGDGSVGSGSQITHTYFNPGLYTVRLFAKGLGTNDAYAKTTIIIGRDSNEKQGLYPLNNSLIASVGGEGSFSLSALGEHDSYQRTIGDIQTTTQNPVLKKKFTVAGTHSITVKAIQKGTIVAATMFSFGVGNNYGSMLLPSTILPEKYEQVVFDTKLSNFLPSDISRVFWNFGDGKILETTETKTNYSYQTVGKKIVLQTIILRNGKKLQNMITLFVSANNLFSSYAIQLLPSSLDINTFQQFSFKISPLGDSFSDILFSNIIAGDGSSNIFPIKTRISFPLEDKHVYKNPGVYYPQTNISLDQCSQLSAQATLAVGGQDFCIQAKLNGSLIKFVCDMDGDGIPDICDNDIDGDGVLNLLGMINPDEPRNCNYLNALKNPNQKLINTDLLKTHFKGICSLDNAPFSSNTNQLDLNKNNIGDAMETDFDKNSIDWLSPVIDSDGDGISDNNDICPLIPESWNGIMDFDGCPELGLEMYCDNNRSPIGIQLPGMSDISSISIGAIIPKDSISSGIQFPIGTIFPDGVIIAGNTTLTSEITLPAGTLLPGGAILPDGSFIPANTTLTSDTTFPSGTTFPGDSFVLDPDEISLDIIDDIIAGGGSDCGNGQQDPGENCLNCPQDMDNCLFITTTPCLQCPCPFVDVNTNLTNNDIVKAVLRDYQKKYPWGYSLDFPIFY
ncbi:MAG: PKD domain-containing protein [Candidatus Absconditabacteria bacterium]|nr:PKD domain-containing protein [Candidatus Absconditabacteria bacterium]